MAENDCSSSSNFSPPCLTPLPPPPPPCPALPAPRPFTKKLLEQNILEFQARHLHIFNDPWQESKKLCTGLISRLSLHDNTLLYLYKPVVPVLQHGPKCGLVALAMASDYLGCGKVDEEAAFVEAKKMGFTKQGEMFSAQYMANLAESLMSAKATVLSDPTQLKEEIIRALLQKVPVIVPYDKDKNCGPCCNKGETAHWALLTGLVAVLKSAKNLPNKGTPDPDIANLYLVPQDTTLTDLTNCGLEHFYVLASQGKSLHTQFWNLDDLLISNQQLINIDPKILANVEDYIVPEGGLARGLNSKVLLLR